MTAKAPADTRIAGQQRVTAIRRDFPIYDKPLEGGRRLVYLDSAASAQKPRVMLERIKRFYSEEYANIHRGVYSLAERATAAFEDARATVARFINAREPAEVVWTRNATEALNLVAYSWGMNFLKQGDVILLTELEHHSNLVPWQQVARKTGAELRYIPVDDHGVHQLENLARLLEGVKLLAVTHVNNSFGTVAPLDRIIPAARAAGALILIDGAQSTPHTPVDVQALDADFFVASGHKMCGPTGIGFLYARRALLEEMPPFLFGGDMISSVTYQDATFNAVPWKFEAGTSAIAEAVGLAASIEYLQQVGMEAIHAHEARIATYALERLRELEPRGFRILGPREPELRSGIISFTFGDIHPHDLASLLATDGVCVRAGHHCTMPLMNRLGLPATARASFYLYNGEDDVDALMRGLEKAARIFRLT